MTTEALCKLAAALKIFVNEREYQRQTQERIETLERAGLSFSPEEFSKVGPDMNAPDEKRLMPCVQPASVLY